ncbi:MAG: YggS family pyridoxal phosphate-dependent enzyme [Candidatus Saganbacteria bacterium]|nr:YggS family pyridoxal phosphate-dependent enzyme [Candidatus Saganbacteria bacterium]
MPDIKANLEAIRQRISIAAQKSGRNPEEIKLIAVTKTVPVELIEQAIQAGIVDIGENRVQEAKPKIEALKQKYPNVTWHMLGHLQRNKVRQALDLFAIIQSVDSERLAKEIEHRLRPEGTQILVEVNTSKEATKYGLPPDSVVDFLKKISNFGNINVRGLMTIGPLADDPEAARPSFIRLRKLSEEIRKLDLPNVSIAYLSMGMTDDFEIAISEGSNMVRIGRAIFGERR